MKHRAYRQDGPDNNKTREAVRDWVFLIGGLLILALVTYYWTWPLFLRDLNHAFGGK